MPDDFFEYLVATGGLDDFLGIKEPNETNNDNDEDIENKEDLEKDFEDEEG